MLRVDPTKAFVALNTVAALGCFAAAIAHPVFNGYGEFFCYFCVVVLTSTLKVTLPGIDGTLSVSFIFLFLGILEMTYAETLLLVVASVVVQSYWNSLKRLKPIQVIFNVSQLTVATTIAYCSFNWLGSHTLREQRPLALACAATVYFLLNTWAMSTVISLTDRKPFRQVWVDGYLWSTLLSLVFVPAFFIVMDDIGRALAWTFGRFVGPRDEPAHTASSTTIPPRPAE